MTNLVGRTLATVALVLAASVQAQERADVVRLGNLKLAHFGAISYIKEIAPKCGIKVEEKTFAKGLDVMQAIIAGELDVGATASEAAIAGRAGGAPIVVVAGFATGGARLVAQPGLNIRNVAQLKGKRVGVTRGAIQEVLLMAELQKHKLSSGTEPGKDVQLVFLSYPDLNAALVGKQIDAMMQSEPQASQALNKGFGAEVLKPYDTPVRTMVMTEHFYKARRPLAEKFMRCFVQATKRFIADPALASKYVRETVFKGQISAEDFRHATGNAPYSYDVTAEHIQVTTDTMAQTGVGRMRRPPVARDWVRTDLLAAAKKDLNVN
ncbi:MULTISPECIES: ABC transporter substrate-binding protein [unclassified Massilia]|uniref:ABC transporter substrate-binding protein n=1 Tax=unclassified Massilia TaxID=2609279 RepID=UPI001783D226|nr:MULTISPECIES: ABC transporter substrate-binding protein [unclassified Massilia]MBD8530813.1 ABC transporter substrate-binding protein [Massilia sp. CFBP 13647]MBD8674512.1 ABC transporter substrate-binding protein [Massilia sp. CFBP 13721]